MKAFVALRTGVHYRREAFARGLEAAGFNVVWGLPAKPEGVLCLWNRYTEGAYWADRFEASGLPVLVAENGYLGNELAGRRWYAIARNQHNGAGTWPIGGPERWDALNVPLAPWRDAGGEVIVLPQRGIGPRGVAMPRDWLASTASRLRAMQIPFRVRPHPGIGHAKPLELDLANASAVVTWGSGAALKALALGIPVYSDFAAWIGAGCAMPLDALAAGDRRTDSAARLAVFRRLAWAQWTLEEVSDGTPFRELLRGSQAA